MRLAALLQAFVLVAIFVLTAAAYDQTLSSESVREAYFLGHRRDQVTADFLARYSRSFPAPKRGPHIARVQALTPYAQMVLYSGEGKATDTVMDAEEDYHAHPRLFVVRVRIYSTPTYSLPFQTDDVARQFPIRVLQTHLLRPVKTAYTRVHSVPHQAPFSGTDVELQFDTTQVASAPMTIEVESPDGHQLEVMFNLDNLK